MVREKVQESTKKLDLWYQWKLIYHDTLKTLMIHF